MANGHSGQQTGFGQECTAVFYSLEKSFKLLDRKFFIFKMDEKRPLLRVVRNLRLVPMNFLEHARHLGVSKAL